jgi:6-phosphogluconate dehydrogenase
MEFGVIGLGRMGTSPVRKAIEKGHHVVGYNRPSNVTEVVAKETEIEPAFSFEELAQKLAPPRVVLIYVPRGKPREATLQQQAVLQSGDIVVGGGNSHRADSKRHYSSLKQDGLPSVDMGTSGRITGARHGTCFMVGGDRSAFELIEPMLRGLAVPQGVIHAGPSGAGHFIVLIRNGIEFGMMQTIAEGADLLSRSEYLLDLPAIFHNGNHGSVIRSWLIELMGQRLREHSFKEVGSKVEDPREVKWVIPFALEKEARIPVISQSEMALYRYRDPDSRAGKAVAIVRNGLGAPPLPDGRDRRVYCAL